MQSAAQRYTNPWNLLRVSFIRHKGTQPARHCPMKTGTIRFGKIFPPNDPMVNLFVGSFQDGNSWWFFSWLANGYTYMYIYILWYVGVSKNRGTPKSSILMGFSIINHPFWETSMYFCHDLFQVCFIVGPMVFVYNLSPASTSMWCQATRAIKPPGYRNS